MDCGQLDKAPVYPCTLAAHSTRALSPDPSVFALTIVLLSCSIFSNCRMLRK